jgi:hypothetical protein
MICLIQKKTGPWTQKDGTDPFIDIKVDNEQYSKLCTSTQLPLMRGRPGIFLLSLSRVGKHV